MHDRVDMDDLERWHKKHCRHGDIYVMESCNNSFETAGRLKKLGANVVVFESLRIGQISKAYLKNDKVDASKIARVYLSGIGFLSKVAPKKLSKTIQRVLTTFWPSRISDRNLKSLGEKSRLGLRIPAPTPRRCRACRCRSSIRAAICGMMSERPSGRSWRIRARPRPRAGRVCWRGRHP